MREGCGRYAVGYCVDLLHIGSDCFVMTVRVISTPVILNGGYNYINAALYTADCMCRNSNVRLKGLCRATCVSMWNGLHV